MLILQYCNYSVEILIAILVSIADSITTLFIPTIELDIAIVSMATYAIFSRNILIFDVKLNQHELLTCLVVK